jgi:hypothetical protein
MTTAQQRRSNRLAMNGRAVDGQQRGLRRHYELAESKRRPITALRDIFLPVGYPDSVAPDYADYQFWDSIQAFCSTVNGLLHTQAMLKGMGVGDAKASAYGALLGWILRDGLSNIGSILFSWRFSRYLDDDCKTWRFVADLFNDSAMLVGLVAPLLDGGWTTVLMSVSSVLSALCGVTGGATRGSITQHFARTNNVADVSAKDGSQETVVNLLGMAVGAWVITVLETHVSDDQTRLIYAWFLFAILTVVHLLANYRAVRVVRLRSFNAQRWEIVLDEWLATKRFMEPDEVARREHVLWWHLFHSGHVQYGVPFTDFHGAYDEHEGYLLCIKGKEIVSVALERGINAETELVAYARAYLQSQGAAETPVDHEELLRGFRHAGWQTTYHHLTELHPHGRYRVHEKTT